nr:hypothetical protein [bacterium]
IESAEGRGISTLDESFHAWLQVKLDGQWYHLDPTFENGDTQGTGLTYFGMTDAQRADAGGYVAPFQVGVYPWGGEAYPCLDERLTALHQAVSWERIGIHTVRLWMRDGTQMVFDTQNLSIMPEAA